MRIDEVMSSAARGCVHGLVATGAMSIVFFAGQRWGTIGKLPPQLIVEHMFAGRTSFLRPIAVVAHLGYGALAGSVFTLLHQRGLRQGVLFGLGVWATSYELWLPAAGVLPAAHRDLQRRAVTIGAAHVVFGGVLGAIARATSRR